MITCSLGDDGVPSYEDTCSFTCNTGYEPTNSDPRTCQSNSTWSGNEAMCNKGEYHLKIEIQVSLLFVNNSLIF